MTKRKKKLLSISKSAHGQKHHGGEYFVLDLNHDEFAAAALQAYANACRHKFPLLASDLRRQVAKQPPEIGK